MLPVRGVLQGTHLTLQGTWSVFEALLGVLQGIDLIWQGNWSDFDAFCAWWM
jgi:hypothetical protein